MHAIVVIGGANNEDYDKLRFENMAADVIDKLVDKFGIKRWNVHKLIYGSPKKIRTALEEIFIEKQKQDILLVYIGHGQENGWGLSGRRGKNSLHYNGLSLILAHHCGKLVFLNCCCFAGAAKNSLLHHSREYLLIAAMPEDRFGYVYNFFHDIFSAWSENRLFNPHLSKDNSEFIPQVEGNEQLQRIFFNYYGKGVK